ncbi:MAG: hypothetical protein HYX95_02460 [Chloroflexi bacterium]|nr:hypothetical protein [Chloroflexota bacterium]MBI4338778.1 hypothetical protein [Chloroflexota bacterium]
MERTSGVKPQTSRIYYGWVIVGVAFLIAFGEAAPAAKPDRSIWGACFPRAIASRNCPVREVGKV